MKKKISKSLTIFGAVGALVWLAFGSVKNFWRTIRMALNREN